MQLLEILSQLVFEILGNLFSEGIFRRVRKFLKQRQNKLAQRKNRDEKSLDK